MFANPTINRELQQFDIFSSITELWHSLERPCYMGMDEKRK